MCPTRNTAGTGIRVGSYRIRATGSGLCRKPLRRLSKICAGKIRAIPERRPEATPERPQNVNGNGD